MADKYTKDDVIIWPDDPRLEGAIGKKVFYSQSAIQCLINANHNLDYKIGVLIGIYENEDFLPFIVEEDKTHKKFDWMCVIIKKED